MMFDTMFPRSPFGYFANQYEDVNPWTNYWGCHTLPRHRNRPRSADPNQLFRRSTRRRQPWVSPFLEDTCQFQDEQEMPTKNPVRRKCPHIDQQKDGNDDRPQTSSPRNNITIPVTIVNEKKPRDCKTNCEKMKESALGKTEGHSPHVKGSKDEREEQKREESTTPVEETIQDMREENPSEGKMECKKKFTCNASNPGENCETGEKALDEGEDKDENMEKEEDNIDEKLKFIDQQLRKARELAPEEVLMSPRTDKQKLYLTEMLLRCILDLDTVETRGNETVKQSRRQAVREIQSYLDMVEKT